MSKTTLEKIELMIETINKIHADFSQDYFDTGRIEKVNLSKTIGRVPYPHITKYRLNLHESINDYLIKNKTGFLLQYYYRVKTLESIDDKISRFSENTNLYPVNNWPDDIFGASIIVNTAEVDAISEQLDEWQEKYVLKNWYYLDKDGYRGLHIYFKNKSNFYFPWELQVWDEKDELSNIETHEKYKRTFV